MYYEAILILNSLSNVNKYIASATCVNKSGYYVTAEHVVRDQISGQINGQPYTVIDKDLLHDVAIIKTSGCSNPAVINPDNTKQGKIKTSGWAGGNYHTTTINYLGYETTMNYYNSPGMRWVSVFTAGIEPGDSGGAIIQNGKYTGVMSGAGWGKSYCATIESVRAILNKNGIKYNTTGVNYMPNVGKIRNSKYV